MTKPLTGDESRFVFYLRRIRNIRGTQEIAFHDGKVHMTLRAFDALTEASLSTDRALTAVEKLAGTDGRPSVTPLAAVTGYYCNTHKERFGGKMAVQLHINSYPGCSVEPIRGEVPESVDWSAKPIAEVQAEADKQRAIKLTGEFTEPPLVTSPYLQPATLPSTTTHEIMEQWAKHEGPHWEHDCEACHYLGSETDAQGRWNDLYYCFGGGKPNLIARHGEMGDYTSGLDWVARDGMLAVAFVLALRAGKIRTSDIA